MKKILSLAVLLLLPIAAEAQTQIFTIPFGQNFLGPVLLNYIPTGNCLTTTTNGQIVGTGAACASGGGGGVTSVTGSGNINSSGGATPNITISNSPTFTGTVTTLNAGVTGTLTVGTNIADVSLVSGQCLVANGGQIITSSGSATCGGVTLTPVLNSGVSGTPSFLPGTGQGPIAVTTFAGINGTVGLIPVGTVIGHINVSCADYNSTDATAGNSPYSPLSSTGLGGGTIQFGIADAAHSGTAPLSLGAVVIPDSPQAGPYAVASTASVGTPYTVLAGDSLVMIVSAVSGTAAQWVSACVPMIGP